MSIEVITLLLFSSIALLFALGLPIAFAFGGVAVIFILWLWGPGGLSIISFHAVDMMSTILMIAIPLFIFMACVLEHSGLADALYTTIHLWLGSLRGGLAMGTVLICTLFAAMSGLSAAGTVTMGIIALPHMLQRGYDKGIAIGCIMAGGALGVLIPPSVVMIVYGLIAGVSIGKLFIAGIFPGLLLSSLFIIYIGIRCYLNPRLGPSLPPEERAGWGKRFISLRTIILPALLVISVLGSIFLGLATPTEAASIGALGSLVCAAIHRKFNWKLLKESAFTTLKLTCMVMWIVYAAYVFAAVYQGIGAPKLIQHLFMDLQVSRWVIIAIMMACFFVLGCFVDIFGILFITCPVFLPVAISLGFDPVWFGILYVLSVEMAYLTPPVGGNLFYMKALVPKGITMGDIYSSVIPFVLLQAVGLFLVILFPQIALWLPSLVFKL